MTVTIRPLGPSDADDVLALNDEVVHKLAPMDLERYRWFLEQADAAWAADHDGAFAGFVLLLGPGLAYDSDNYRWFSARHDRFLYLDRVAVASTHRRAGLGTAIYDAVEARAAAQRLPVLLEVNVEPPNHASLAFHERRGYDEVGTLEHPGGKVVRLLAKQP